MVHLCISVYILFYRQYNIANIDCVSYTPTGPCSESLSVYDHPVQLSLNTSSQTSNISFNQRTADLYLGILRMLDPHKKCSDVLKAFICHWVFATCDPAYNVSVNQQICRRGCEILSTIVCPETWNIVITQQSILDFRGLGPPNCSDQLYSNGGEVPDCIDPTDGGEQTLYCVVPLEIGQSCILYNINDLSIENVR